MALRLLAGSCDVGPCPTLRIDDSAGIVEVQGYRTTRPATVPDHEDVVHIPVEDWATLLSRLPLRMLIGALIAKPRSRRPRASEPAPVAALR